MKILLQFIASSGFYKESALETWAISNIADPWLIASASANGYILVTEEVASSGLSKKNQQKKG